MKPFDSNDPRYQSLWEEDRIISSRFGGNRRDDEGIRFARAVKEREERHKYYLKRLLILFLLMLMLMTGGFGVFPGNPVTAMFQDQIVSNMPVPLIEFLNFYFSSASVPTLKPAPPVAQTPPSSQLGVDIVGFLIGLFNREGAIPAAPIPQQIDSLAGVETLVYESALTLAHTPTSITETASSTPTSTVTATSSPEPPTPTPTQKVVWSPVFYPPPQPQNPPDDRKPAPSAPQPDVAASVTGTTPANGAINVAPDAIITINFSDAVNVTAASFTITCGAAQAFTVAGSGTNAITLTPTAQLPFATTCTVTAIAANITDVDTLDPPDTLAADYTFTFTIVNPYASVTSTNPANGATGVATNTAITIIFDKNVSLDPSAFTIDCGAVQAFNLDGSGTNTAILTPSLSLPTSTTCTVTVSADLCPDCGWGMLADYVFTFSTAAVATDNAPTVLSTYPMNGATGILIGSTITIDFSEAVNVTGASFTLDCSGFTVGGTGTATITLTPTAPLPYSTTCNVTVIAAQVTDTDGIAPANMAADYPFSFTTEAPPPVDTAPSVTTTIPANGDTGVSTGATITINFSENVTVDTTTPISSSFTVDCSGIQNLASITGDTTNSIILTPSAALPASTMCTVTVVAAQVSDMDGIAPANMAADYIFTFTTGP